MCEKMVSAEDIYWGRAGIIVMSLVLIVLIAFPGVASADIIITSPSSNQTFSETNDFPSRRFADPWDMNRWTDLSYGQYYHDITNFRFKGGMVSGRTTGTDAYFHPLFPGYRDAVPMGRDGGINRIDTSRYDSFSVRLYSNRRTSAQILWFFNNVWTDYGVSTFCVYPGWHTYKINLSSNSKWTGKPMGLRFDPTYHSGVHFKVDWMRLYRQSTRRVTLKWTDAEPGQTVNVYLDRDNKVGNNGLEELASQTSNADNSFTWDPSAYQPGAYFFYIKKAGRPGVHSKRIYINRIPLISILNPDEKGGKDYAAVETGNPWDMKNINDLSHWDVMTRPTFKGGVLTAKTQHGDGYFHLRVTKPINTNKYHRLTFRYRYDGPFDFGLGTMSRFIWSPNRWDISKYSTSDDIVVYPRWREYTIDLKKMPLDAGRRGWTRKVREFRFDPLEVPRPWRFYVDYVRLTADDWANRGMTIQWKEGRLTPRPTKVAIYYDKNRSGFNGKLIAKGLKSAAGKNSYKWNTRKVPEGKYWIHITANDGISSSKVYSTGPVVIEH